jgi:putative phosphoribosyl transferase
VSAATPTESVHGAARVVLAVPVASRQAVSQLHQVADEVIAVETPEPFNAVGEWYLDFDHTSDQQMVNLLIESDATGIEASPRSA